MTKLKLKPGDDYPQWFFMWTKGQPYLTTICGWTRKSCRSDVVKELGLEWKRVYKQGGRIAKVNMSVVSV